MFTEFLPSILLGAILLGCAVGLMSWHYRTWRAAQQRGLEAREYDYRRHQFRRRMQTTAMLGIVALALPLGVLIIRYWPKVGVFYWGVVLLIVLWVILLAMLDAWTTHYYYGRLRDGFVIEQAKLQAELNRLQGGRRNGKPSSQRNPQGLPTPDDGDDEA